MPIFEVAFKVRHNCPACNLSRNFASAKMLGWCNRGYEVIEISATDKSQLEAIRSSATSLGGVMQMTVHGENDLIITKKCLCTTRNSVLRNLDSHNMLHLLPIAYEAGWEYYRAIAFRDLDFVKFSKAVERLPSEIVVLRKSLLEGRIGGLITVSLSGLFADLTSKQAEALLTAYLMGYFSFPRKTNVLHIAKMKNLARTTFQEHLNKAENKMMSSLAPYLQLVQTKSIRRSRS